MIEFSLNRFFGYNMHRRKVKKGYKLILYLMEGVSRIFLLGYMRRKLLSYKQYTVYSL